MPTFYDRFVECAERWPQNVALEIQRSGELESYTYGELRRMAESVGRWLKEQDLAPGSRCAILADNHPRWVAAYLGIIAAGHTAVPLDTAFHADQVVKLLRDSGSVLLFCDAKHAGVVQEVLKEVSVGIVGLSSELRSEGTVATEAVLNDMLAEGHGSFAPASPALDSIAAILYTSGTTADPKGVMLTHGNMLGEVAAVFGWADIGPGDAVLGILPLFHSLAQMANLLLPLVKGARVVYLETLNTTELLRALRERNITAFAVVPQFFYLIHERIFKEAAKHGPLMVRALRAMMTFNRGLRKIGLNAGSLLFGKIHDTFGRRMRYLVTGGSRFEPEIGHDFYALGIDVLQAYGLTETCGGAFATDPSNNVIGSVGKPLPGNEARIIDPQGDGQPVGEIAIRGPIVMKGYWNRPDATAEVLRDGWLYTGDIGYFDKSGNLFITGRSKEVIVLSNGKNVYPEEIEAHYLKSPFIKEICVLGLEGKPGGAMSDQLYAVVVPNFEALKERKIVNTKEIIRFDIENLSSQIASTKRIASYEIWQEDLPRTTTRKIKRFEVEKRVRANLGKKQSPEADTSGEKPLTSEDEAWLARPEVQRALTLIKESARNAPERIRPDHNLELDLGLDSMQRVELLIALETELGGDVPESQIADIYSVRQLVDTVLESARSGKSAARTAFAGWASVLQEEPTDPEVLDLIKPRPFAEVFWFLATRLAQLLSRDLYDLHAEGVEKVPTDRPVIISSNHQSFIDPVVLLSLLPWQVFRNSFAVGTSEIFGQGLMRMLGRWIRVISVDPDANLVPAMRAAAFGLRHGRVLILYPEGERSIDGTPKTFRKGAAILSIHMQVPIVPVAIEGFYEAWPRGKYFFQKLTHFRMKFGDPLYPPPESSVSEEAYAQLTAEVKRRVVDMWEKLPRN